MLKIKRCRRCFHFPGHFAQRIAPAALEKPLEPFDVFAVRLAVYFIGTGGAALLDEMQQTGTKVSLLGIIFQNFQVAGTEFERPLKVDQRLFQGITAGKRTV